MDKYHMSGENKTWTKSWDMKFVEAGKDKQVVKAKRAISTKA